MCVCQVYSDAGFHDRAVSLKQYALAAYYTIEVSA